MAEMATVDHGTVVYPDSDGQPMAENELQGRQITRLVQQLDRYFGDRDDVHVGFDLLWYPVEGDPSISRAPDVFVVPGRPKGPARPSWLQWREDGTPMRHVIEILSPSSRRIDLVRKPEVLAKFGIKHYWVVDPLNPAIRSFRLRDGVLVTDQVATGEDLFETQVPFPVRFRPADLMS